MQDSHDRNTTDNQDLDQLDAKKLPVLLRLLLLAVALIFAIVVVGFLIPVLI